jgi:hypothetical protein
MSVTILHIVFAVMGGITLMNRYGPATLRGQIAGREAVAA